MKEHKMRHVKVQQTSKVRLIYSDRILDLNQLASSNVRIEPDISLPYPEKDCFMWTMDVLGRRGCGWGSPCRNTY